MENKLGQEPAFPYSTKNTSTSDSFSPFGSGMSKRFYAACAAMQGILAANPKDTWGNSETPVPEYVSRLSYEFADELLKQENS